MRKFCLAFILSVLCLSCSFTAFAAPAAANNKDTGVGAQVTRSVRFSLSDDYDCRVSYDDPSHPQIHLTWQVTLDEAVLYPGETVRLGLTTDGVFRGEEDADHTLAFTTDFTSLQADGSQTGESFPLTVRLDGTSWDKVPVDTYAAVLTFRPDVLDAAGNVVLEGEDEAYTVAFAKEDIQVDEKPDESQSGTESGPDGSDSSQTPSDVPSDSGSASRPAGGGDSPKTGEGAAALSFMGLAVLSGAAVLTLRRGGRK